MFTVNVLFVMYINLHSFVTEKRFNSLTTKKQTTKFSSANFQKMLSPSYIILRIQKLAGTHYRSR